MNDNDNDPQAMLSQSSFAVIYDPENGYQLMVPEMDEEAEMPVQAVALIAAGMRLQDDPGFMEELVNWLAEKNPQ